MEFIDEEEVKFLLFLFYLYFYFIILLYFYFILFYYITQSNKMSIAALYLF